jgi:hypothetical protein
MARLPARFSAGRGARLAGLFLLLTLTACGGDDGDDPTPVAVATATFTAPSGAAPAPTNAPIGSPPVARGGAIVGDSFCLTRLPAGWFEEGPGRGSSPSGQSVLVTGNRLRDDAGWTAAVSTFRSQLESAGATVEEGDGWISATYPDERGFAHRARFENRWCDVRLRASSGSLPAGELAAWEGIVASLAPVADGGS